MPFRSPSMWVAMGGYLAVVEGGAEGLGAGVAWGWVAPAPGGSPAVQESRLS